MGWSRVKWTQWSVWRKMGKSQKCGLLGKIVKCAIGGTVVLHSPPQPKVEGLSLATASGIWGLYYQTLYGRNLQIFVISQSVCPWQAFPA